jgi:hypothetical protein
MEAFTLHTEPSVFPGWCLFLLASRRPILLHNRSNFLGMKCVCTQKRLFVVNKRLLHQILSINENTFTWFDNLAVQKCQLQCFQFGSAWLAMGIVTRSAWFSSVRPGSARLAVSMRPKHVIFQYLYGDKTLYTTFTTWVECLDHTQRELSMSPTLLTPVSK